MSRINLLTMVLLITFFNSSFGQYQMSLMNDVQTGPSTYEFDVFIKSTSADFNLTSYILVFTFNPSIANGGTLTFSYIAGSSALSNLPNVYCHRHWRDIKSYCWQ
jgi:hypothetical protein